MQIEEVADGSRLSAATRFELLVGVSNAIGTHRDPQELFGVLVRELHRVIRFDYIGVYIRDEKSNTFRRHSVDAETEAVIPPDPELAMEESDAWWVYQNQKPLVTSLEARGAGFGLDTGGLEDISNVAFAATRQRLRASPSFEGTTCSRLRSAIFARRYSSDTGDRRRYPRPRGGTFDNPLPIPRTSHCVCRAGQPQ